MTREQAASVVNAALERMERVTAEFREKLDGPGLNKHERWGLEASVGDFDNIHGGIVEIDETVDLPGFYANRSFQLCGQIRELNERARAIHQTEQRLEAYAREGA